MIDLGKIKSARNTEQPIEQPIVEPIIEEDPTIIALKEELQEEEKLEQIHREKRNYFKEQANEKYMEGRDLDKKVGKNRDKLIFIACAVIAGSLGIGFMLDIVVSTIVVGAFSFFGVHWALSTNVKAQAKEARAAAAELEQRQIEESKQMMIHLNKGQKIKGQITNNGQTGQPQFNNNLETPVDQKTNTTRKK